MSRPGRRALALAALAVAGCVKIPSPPLSPISSFGVKVTKVYTAAGLLPVVTACAKRYGSQANVPAEVRGTHACKYAIPRGDVMFDVSVTALDNAGNPALGFSGPVSFRVVPGDLGGDYASRWRLATGGKVDATIHAVHQYGEVRVWAENGPPKPLFDAGVQLGGPGDLPPADTAYTFAGGISAPVEFDDQTLQSLQIPDGFDNRSSPFVGEFVTVGKNPESGEQLLQSCDADPRRDGQPAAMVVTGIDPAGFFVTDITACRLVEWTTDSTGATQVRTPEAPEPCLVTQPDGSRVPIESTDAGTGACDVSQRTCRGASECPRFMPGTFASMYVYNYNVPDNLDTGDLIFTLSGAVQEFTSTTQVTFPGWTVAERVRTLPAEQWNKYLQFAKPYDLSGRTCGMDNAWAPYLTDVLCGHNKRNLKMESLESALVRLRSVKLPEVFKNCDFNGDQSVPFYCEQKDDQGNWFWGSCAFPPSPPEPEADRVERECTQDCVLGVGEFDGKVCAEESTFVGYGQYVVQLNSPGPRSAGLDDALPLRTQQLALSAGADGGLAVPANVGGFYPGADATVVCDVPTYYRFGPTGLAALPTDPQLAANQVLPHHFVAGEAELSLLAGTLSGRCWVSFNPVARINLITKDALPELAVECSESDSNADRAQQCKNLHGATFDVVGHLKQVQPARPRWVVIPRHAEDMCCHPGPSLGCPKPVKPCQ